MDNEKATTMAKPAEKAIELLQKLPEKERLRVGGEIIELSMANHRPYPKPSQASA